MKYILRSNITAFVSIVLLYLAFLFIAFLLNSQFGGIFFFVFALGLIPIFWLLIAARTTGVEFMDLHGQGYGYTLTPNTVGWILLFIGPLCSAIACYFFAKFLVSRYRIKHG